ncbi:UbiC transcription regulator-associated domain protein [Clostridiales bacterium oral taxon 876 str. F0540]|nr:UbiC transcription regulator-associated domain protein [Clostridiales bacterium oral taxon 876 str. F0540]
MSKLPVYMVMHDALKEDIQRGKYLVGELLPTEPELEKIFNVSRTTVRRAMELLRQEGIVEIKQGKGTSVVDFRAKQDLNKVTSVTESLRRKGYIVRTKSMYIDTIPASEKLAEELQVDVGKLIARVQRIQLANERPIVIMKNYIPYDKVSGIEEYTDKFSGLYEFLEKQYNIEITNASDKIYAKSADFTESEMLNVPPKTALLCIRRICYNHDKPVCVDQISVLADHYELEVSMSGRYK